MDGVDGFVDGADAHELIVEREMELAPERPTGLLFHYTTAEAAIEGILPTGTLRISPFPRTNDLWESRPFYLTVSSHYDDRSVPPDQGLWEEIDRHIRRHAKVACLTRDLQLPDELGEPDALRGWAHLPLWAHYGERGAGVCLGFNQQKLIEGFMKRPVGSKDLRFHGPVHYRRAPALPVHGIDIGQIREYGVDAAALFFAEKNKERIFFRKNIAWSTESEYRLVLIDRSELHASIDIRQAITEIVLGESFPPDRRNDLTIALNDYPDVEVRQLTCHNRCLRCFPAETPGSIRQEASSHAWATPRRDGPLEQRWENLRAAEEIMRTKAEHAQDLAAAPLLRMEHGMRTVWSALLRPNAPSPTLTHHILAVPEQQRARKAGVPGEVVHFEKGLLCVACDRSEPLRALSAAAALQVLEGEKIRLHGVIILEDPDGSDRGAPTEIWRGRCVSSTAGATDAVARLISELHKALPDALKAFEEACN